MALHWRPVGPEPASIYWQRRAVALLVVVAAVLLVRALLPGGGDDADTLASRPAATPSASAAPVPAPSASAVPTPAPTPTAATACAPTALKVEALAEQDEYAVGGTPRLTLKITNTGATPCSRDLGAAAVELLVVSGSDRIFSSDDCNPGGDPAVRTLAPGAVEEQRITWDGRRSRPGCAGDKEQAQPGTYRVGGRLGDVRVEGDVFRITG